MKKLNLNETWRLQLQQSGHIARRKKAGDVREVCQIKQDWLTKHGFEDVENDCFFCEYDNRQQEDACKVCPARKIDKTFTCCRSDYHYRYRAVDFYKKLRQLNKIRLAKAEKQNGIQEIK